MSDLTRLPTLTVQSHRTPFSFFTPTHLSFAPRSHSHSQSPSSTSSSSSTKDTSQNVTWQSRKARKGRYLPKTTHVHSAAHAQGAGAGGEEKAQGGKREVAARLKHPGSRLKPGFTVDISFWVAVSFTFGSMVWVVNGFVVWFPILRPSLDTTAFTNTSSATAFIGGTVFLVGSYLMVVEALDRYVFSTLGRESQFGTALGELLHYHRNHPSGSSTSVNKEQSPERDDSIGHEVKVVLGASGWVWWGKPLWHDMGYLAAVVQLFAATIFWISTLTGLPGVIKGFSTGDGSKAIIDVFFWTPQVIGGSGFIVSSLILMVEVQKKWYIPALSDIGWHIGFWNLVGAIGFTLCGALGYSSSSGAVYESALSTWWGSWAFLIGSGIQCAETVWREPGK
ncbi:hypothetical protein BCR39DRAFT_566903 [Naematelia encephala]|uniref:Integral membrane protein n=1 Tax=Naematelia encephala TaxID=71784 RepID=A0A1Y2ALW2_9TREE|nr:hypothetical protein BCR39DRAFT_566903 [Naematelia encephala]